ncbi:MAG: hypothetical protein JNN12_03550 [Bacteroidetes Order II. Incertae sedis bacterium]|nr:hypothetical protein [Bacteroidetes Order II. bacterium]
MTDIKKRDREQLEAELKQRSEAIASRVRETKADLTETGETLSSGFKRYQWAFLAGAVVVGAAAGVLLTCRKRPQTMEWLDVDEPLSSDIRITDDREVVRKAVKKGIPVVVYKADASGRDVWAPFWKMLHPIMDQVIKLGGQLFSDVLQDRLAFLTDKIVQMTKTQEPNTDERMVDQQK